MATSAPHQLRSDLIRLAHRGLGVRDFSHAAARLLERTVPFDGMCVLTMDPATMLPTDEVIENGLPPAATTRMTEIELDGRDVNCFAALAGMGRHVATLSRSTGGQLDRSLRHRELRGPHGFGDELRAVLVGDRTPWGALTLLRGADRRHFTSADAERVALLAPCLAEGLRRAMLLGELAARPDGDDETIGLVVLAADNTVALTDAAGDRWLTELRSNANGCSLPPSLRSVVAQARRGADRPTTEPSMARARVRSASGRWLVVRGSILGPASMTALIIEPARSHDLAPLVAADHGLTDRERTITQLVARGCGTAAIAERLHLSAWTVQDHLKAIFDKVGVRTRGELVARLFIEHHPPQLSERTMNGRRAEPC